MRSETIVTIRVTRLGSVLSLLLVTPLLAGLGAAAPATAADGSRISEQPTR